MAEWYSRPVLFVADVGRAVRHYVGALGFAENWRHSEGGKALVAQVERDGCEILLSAQWPDKTGRGMLFVSLNPDRLDALRQDLEARGVAVRDGSWGYRVLIVDNPDGNALYFPYPKDPADAEQRGGGVT